MIQGASIKITGRINGCPSGNMRVLKKRDPFGRECRKCTAVKTKKKVSWERFGLVKKGEKPRERQNNVPF